MIVTADNTFAVPMGAGATLTFGQNRWENLASFGAGACVIIGAWVPQTRKLLIVHLNVGNGDLNQVWNRIHQLRGNNPVRLYLASNDLFDTPNAHLQGWYRNIIAFAEGNTRTGGCIEGYVAKKSTKLAISAQTGEYRIVFTAKDVYYDADDGKWCEDAPNNLSWKDLTAPGTKGSKLQRSNSFGSL
jgi:hypothetical protein